MARAEAEEAGRVKDEFLATLSHELRTPLNAILGWAHMLRDPQLPPDRRRPPIDTIVRNAQSQEQLIADILDVQRIMAGKIRLNLRTVDLGDIVRAAAETVQPSADAKHVRLQLLLDLDTPPITGDSDRLQQVVWNLLSNAIKFAPQGGHVQVRLLKSRRRLRARRRGQRAGHQAGIHSVHVRALPPGRFVDHAHAQRARPGSRNRPQPGRDARRHDRRGQQPRRRARPARCSPSACRARRPAADRGAAAPAVDREPIWLDEAPSLDGVACSGRRRRRRRARTDRRNPAALRRGRHADCIGGRGDRPPSSSDRPDVMVSDIEMPDEDGYGLIRRIRALTSEAGGDMPAAALTAYASPADRMKVLGAGFNIHVAKPVQPAELAIVVASLAGRRH